MPTVRERRGLRSPYFFILILASTIASSPVLAYGLAVSAFTAFRIRPASPCSHHRASISMRIPLCVVPNPKNSEPHGDPEGEGMHTYVEGLDFGSRAEEVLAKGGDPFFLPDDDDGEDDDNVDAVGQDFSGEEDSMPSMAFMSNIASMPGTLDVVGKGPADSSSSSSSESSSRGNSESRSSSIPFDGPGAGGLHSRPEGEGFDDQKAALLDMGGDPFFLQEDEDDGVDVDEIKNEDRFDAVEDDFLWDGMVDEDAHMDFD